MLVTIVAVGLPDGSGLDISRLEKVEDLDPEIAQKMLDGGTAREPSVEELAAYRKATEAKQDAKAEADEPKPEFDDDGTLPDGATTATNDTAEPKPVAAAPASE